MWESTNSEWDEYAFPTWLPNYKKRSTNPWVMLTFAGGIDATPGAVVPAKARRRANQLEALGTHEMDLVSDKELGAKLGSVSWGFQRGAGGGSWMREKESMREMLVTCGVSLPTSSGILCLGIYTCHLAAATFHGEKTLGRPSVDPGSNSMDHQSTCSSTSVGGTVKHWHNT